MGKICSKCGYGIEEINGAWYDVYDDDACYDEELNYQGVHEPDD